MDIPTQLALVCGAETVEDIAFFGETHLAWLKQYLALPNGTPSADTILRVLGRIDRRKFEECFRSWTRGYFKERKAIHIVSGPYPLGPSPGNGIIRIRDCSPYPGYGSGNAAGFGGYPAFGSTQMRLF